MSLKRLKKTALQLLWPPLKERFLHITAAVGGHLKAK